MPVYKLIYEQTLNTNILNIFNINPEKEFLENINVKESSVSLYKINIKNRPNGIPFTNSIFYNNQNQTLPVGMDLSTKMLVDFASQTLENEKNYKFNVVNFEDEADEFAKFEIKTVNVFEYNAN